MAYMYDEMGNIIGEYESEEERKRREELANTEVSKTEVKTYADGSQEEIVKRQVPAPVAPTAQAAPAPAVAQPVSPDQVFNRMVQVESGGQQFNKQGGVLTSPAGAQGIAQIMPATARAPGFGVAPATPEEIATPEGNRAFGERYFQGLLKHFNGDVAKATAAYNAGPGAVQKNVQANQGQMNVAQLPQETQGYLSKVLGNVANAIIPSAQAGTLTEEQRNRAPTITPTAQPAPAPAAAPAPAPATGVDYSLTGGAPTGAFGLRPTSLTPQPTTVTPESTASIDRYQANQDNVLELIKMSRDETTPQWMRERASSRAVSLAREEDERNKAQQRLDDLTMRVASGDPKASREMANELKSDGSWVKMLLLGFISPQLAGEEAMKLGFGNRDRAVYDADGNPGVVTFRADGKPLSGVKADGTPMSQRELIIYAGGGKRDLDIVGGTYVNDATGEIGRVVTDKKTGQSFIQTDAGRKPMTGFRPQSSTGSLANMRDRAVQDINLKLRGKGIEESMAILRDYNKALVGQGYQPVQPSEVGINVPQISGGQAAPAPTTAPAPAGVTGPVAPSAQPAPAVPRAPTGQVTAPAVPGAPAPTGARPTMTQLEADKTKAKEAAQEVGTDLGKLQAGQGKSEESADYLLTKVDELITHPGFTKSVGVYDVGGIPIPYGATVTGMIPGSDVSDWDKRFKEVQGRQFLQAVEAMKGSGSLSDKEGDAATQAIARMDKSQSEKEFKAAVDDFKGIIQRGIDNTRKKLGQEAKYGTAPESSGKPSVPTAGPVELSPADKARAELERRKKKQGQ